MIEVYATEAFEGEVIATFDSVAEFRSEEETHDWSFDQIVVCGNAIGDLAEVEYFWLD